MTDRHLLAGRALALISCACATIWSSSSGALAARAVIPAGSAIQATLNLSLNTKSAYVGQPISMNVQSPYPSNGAGLQGAIIYGHVAQVQKAGQGRNPQLELVVDHIKSYGSSSQIPISAYIDKIAPKQGPNYLTGAAGAAVGMLLGNWIGKTIGTNAGGAVGLAAGFMLASNNKKDINVSGGSEVTVHLTQALSL
ncbi:MAG TPA: hypothetical protein VKF82_02680 [Candidatus Eremiobacteraceae bacterium]|nr:hypothetical protein [Candidatus Eremiobacteraceae bacterium]